jgi:hypothetical protein
MPVNDLCYKLHIEWIDLALYQLADIVAGDAYHDVEDNEYRLERCQ